MKLWKIILGCIILIMLVAAYNNPYFNSMIKEGFVGPIQSIISAIKRLF